MKKLLILPILLSASMTANAGLWDKVSTFNQEEVKPTATYLVETSGWNVRIVEWIPKDNPNYRCVFGGGDKKGGIACYPANLTLKSKTKGSK